MPSKFSATTRANYGGGWVAGGAPGPCIACGPPAGRGAGFVGFSTELSTPPQPVDTNPAIATIPNTNLRIL